MSKESEKIINNAKIFESDTGKLSKKDGVIGLTQIYLAGLFTGKSPSGLTLRRIDKRLPKPLTTKEKTSAYDDANKVYELMIGQKKKEVESIYGELPDYLSFSENGVLCMDFIKYTDFLKHELSVYTFLGEQYIYDINTCFYRRHINEIETSAREMAKKYNLNGKLGAMCFEINAHMAAMGSITEYPFVGIDGSINVKNGILSLDTGDLSQHSPDGMFDYRIETDYVDYENETPELDVFLELYGTEEPVYVLAKILWQRAFCDTLKELTVFYGPKDCGKTTLCELIQTTLDGSFEARRNVSRTLLHELLQRFGYSDLEGKLMNYGDDLPNMFIKSAGRINELLGSVIRHIEKKGKDGYDAVVPCYYVFSANDLPPLDDDDNVMWSKIHLVHCQKKVPDNRVPRQQLYTDTLKQQLLYRAVMLARYWIGEPYRNEQTADDVREKWQESSTSIELFKHECMEEDMFGAGIKLVEIEKEYHDWCLVRERPAFIRFLRKMLKPYVKVRDGYVVYKVKMVEWKSFSEHERTQQVQTD